MASGARGNFWLALTILVIFGSVALLLTLGKQIVDEQERLSEARSDNFEWTTYQIETDMLRLVAILHQTVEDAARTDAASDVVAADLNEVRKRFDVFYSRASIVRQGQGFAILRADEQSLRRIDLINQFLQDHVPFIDGSDTELLQHLPTMQEALR